METTRILKWTLILLSVVVLQQAGATPAPLYKVKNDHVGSMSDHIAFLTLMQELTRAETRNAHAASIKLIEDRMSLDHAHAALFLQFMLSSYDQIMSTNRATANRMLCSGTTPKYGKSDVHQVLGVLDNLKEANLRHSWQRARTNLGANAARHLNEWLATIKLVDSNPTSDVRAAYLGHDRNIAQVLDDACSLASAW